MGAARTGAEPAPRVLCHRHGASDRRAPRLHEEDATDATPGNQDRRAAPTGLRTEGPAMRHRDYVAEREARDPAFKAAREALRPQREWQRALIRARIKAGLTQHQLAERLGTKQSAIARWESGRVCPTVD